MQTMPYGTWPSPITAESLTEGSAGIDEVRLDLAETYWLESRPWERGRVVLVRHDRSTGETVDVVGPDWNVRNRVHEYGGGSYAVEARTIVFSSFSDGRLWRTTATGAEPTPITPEGADVRFGGVVLRGDVLYAVREDHRAGGEPTNHLVRLDLAGPNAEYGHVIWDASDFVSRPAVSPDGREIVWVSWEHPNMPWDSTLLRRATLTADGASGHEILAGGEGISVVQPQYAPDGSLWFASDESGWWNLVRDDGTGPVPRHLLAADVASPQWVLGMVDFATLDGGGALLRFWREGIARLALLGPDGDLMELDVEGTGFDQLTAAGAEIAFRRASADSLPDILRGTVTPEGSVALQTIARSSADVPDPAYLSRPQPWSWTNAVGLDAHGFVYPPTNADATAPAGELPPLLLFVHGGPTSHSEPVYRTGVQYWTSRGFMVLDVNHGGGTAYGRAYRERLKGQWGVVDIEDCVSGARSLDEAGRVAADRVAIRGGSAGGYVVLRTLTVSSAFAAGASYFGISDLSTLLVDDHKFESRYTTTLVGPWPEAADTYRERSPIHAIENLHGELLLLQGADDLVVKANQAELMAEAMKAAGKDVELVIYEGEGHGFRRADTIIDSLERELAFYLRTFGLTPPQTT